MPVPFRTSPQLSIRAADPHVYDVTITHRSGATTRHCVQVEESLLAELGVSAAQEPILVRSALALMLEHTPTSLPDRFGLADIRDAVPDFTTRVLGRI